VSNDIGARTSAIDWTERAALGASVACLAHCLALPLLLAALPGLSAILAIPESFHRWVLAFAIPAAGFALLYGYAQHRARIPLVAGIAGLVLLALGALLFDESRWETLVTVAGSLVLAGAHLANWRLRHEHAC
jgi:hypothetical protein